MPARPTSRTSDDETPPYAAPLVGFKTRKAAQLSAYLASKCENSGIDKLKLIKLVYLSERAFLGAHHMPMLFDELYSLPHGPICSSTLNGIDGIIHKDTWDCFITRHGRDKVYPSRRFSRDDFDELSKADLAAADDTWGKFGSMATWELRDYTHKYCPEYTETSGRIPISYREVLEALGETDAGTIDVEISSIRRAESILAS